MCPRVFKVFFRKLIRPKPLISFYIPIIGGVIASFLAIVSTVAATLSVIEGDTNS